MKSIDNNEISTLKQDLLDINQQLWQVEDDIRELEARNEFGSAFIELARSVYKLNDERARLKREINVKLSSELIEEKSYSET